MCGIAGFIGCADSRSSLTHSLSSMLDAIVHRGPDAQGRWIDPKAGVALGHRRLAIVDLSQAGSQPMHSVCGRWVITFNGEIYNYNALRKELEKDGWSEGWKGHSDTEVLLAAITLYGVEKALEKCVGMFAFALWDCENHTLTMGRDRLGEKPLYYGWVGKDFVFGSDLAALRQYPKWSGEINRDALSLLMRHNYIPAPYSIYSNISKLQPGKILILSAKTRKINLVTYWSAANSAQCGHRKPFNGSKEEAVNRLEYLLCQSISDQMMADVPLGAFLSGGIDSSLVVALMQSMSEKPVRSFTIGFHEKGYNEAEHARAVAKHLGTDHTELYVSPKEALNIIPQLPKIYSEPFSDSSQIPTYLVSKLAKKHVTVSLSGDGGDELFCGYTRYAMAEKLKSRLAVVPSAVRSGLARIIQEVSPESWNNMSACLMKAVPKKYRFENFGDKVHKLAGLFKLTTDESIYRSLISHWQSPEELVSNSKEPLTMVTGLEQIPSFHDFTRRMMYLDTVSYLPDDILTKVDRAAMGVSLETRVPMLDHRVVSFAMSLPLNILTSGGSSKWPLRQLLYRYVPYKLVERPKMGFGVPIDSWLRGPLRDWGEALLDSNRLKSEGFFDARIVRLAWEEHQSKKRNRQYLLWDILMFQAWLDQTKRV